MRSGFEASLIMFAAGVARQIEGYRPDPVRERMGNSGFVLMNCTAKAISRVAQCLLVLLAAS